MRYEMRSPLRGRDKKEYEEKQDISYLVSCISYLCNPWLVSRFFTEIRVEESASRTE